MDNIKDIIRERYGRIAISRDSLSCCPTGSDEATTCCSSDSYNNIGSLEMADLGLGCGAPVDHADIREGMTVLDLGSGAGIDAFIAAKHVGANGKVIGVDMTAEMIERARDNSASLNIRSVEFRLGEIEDLPIKSESIDRVISNCVINLVPDKRKAFSEVFRVLKPGGSFAISDIVSTDPIHAPNDAELWCECIAGAIEKDQYLSVIHSAGFKNVRIVRERRYEAGRADRYNLLSITITGEG